jgi:formylglycine-generating enzyme required for sulfatase activity
MTNPGFLMNNRISLITAVLLMIASVGAVGRLEFAPRMKWQSGLQREITNSIGMKLVLIPAGTFQMGSPRGEPERQPDETRHEVTITKPFYMGIYEVTQAQYAKLMDPKTRAFFNSDRGGSPEHPMEDVLWTEADEYCQKLTALKEETSAGRKYRLPTEAEWEYACRAGTTTAFHFGDSLSSLQANFNGNGPYGTAEEGPYLRQTAKVGSYPPNAFGLYDMHGNVAEWCADWYDPEYYNASPDEDPPGPPAGVLPDDYENFYVVIRGGCWLDDARACRSAYRHRAMHRNRYRLIGFRVVCDTASASSAPLRGI